jgi:acyl carrier protein
MQANLRNAIEAEFQRVADEHEKHLAPLTDDLELLNSGLDSLSFAVVVVRLEETLGVDPFSSEEVLLFPSTFGEFVRVYEKASCQT